MVVVEPMEYYAGKSKWDDTIRPQKGWLLSRIIKTVRRMNHLTVNS